MVIERSGAPGGNFEEKARVMERTRKDMLKGATWCMQYGTFSFFFWEEGHWLFLGNLGGAGWFFFAMSSKTRDRTIKQKNDPDGTVN